MDDEWFDNDPFDSIVRQFFGESPQRRRRYNSQREDEQENEPEIIETNDSFYVIFEMPGYSKEDIIVGIKDRHLEIKAIKKEGEEIMDYLFDKLQKGMIIKKTLPSFISSKNFTFTCINGILEIKFNKK